MFAPTKMTMFFWRRKGGLWGGEGGEESTSISLEGNTGEIYQLASQMQKI